MKRVFSLILAALLLLTGCAGQGSASLSIYYPTELSPTEYGNAALDARLWAPEGEVTAELLFDQLSSPPEEDGLRPVIPSGTKLLSATQAGSCLTLDLSEHYGSLSDMELTLANFSILLTMTQLEQVSSVVILVEGQPLLGADAEPLTLQSALMTGELQDPMVVGFRLFFPNADHSALSEDYQEAEVYGAETDDRLRTLLQLLVSGPRDTREMSSPFVGLESYLRWQWVDGVCVLLLTDSWAQVLLSDELALQSLVDSLCACEGVEGVAFSWEGEGAEALEGTFLSSGG